MGGGITCVTAQQRLVGKVADEVLEGGKLVEAELVDAVFALHMKMLHRILCSARPRGKKRLQTTDDFKTNVCRKTGYLGAKMCKDLHIKSCMQIDHNTLTLVAFQSFQNKRFIKRGFLFPNSHGITAGMNFSTDP